MDAGLDVHKATVVACIMGTGIKMEIRTYLTMTNDPLSLKAWLKDRGITHVAMESRGVTGSWYSISSIRQKVYFQGKARIIFLDPLRFFLTCLYHRIIISLTLAVRDGNKSQPKLI